MQPYDKVVVFDKDGKPTAEKSIVMGQKALTLDAMPAGEYSACYTDGKGLEISARKNFSVGDNSGVENVAVKEMRVSVSNNNDTLKKRGPRM